MIHPRDKFSELRERAEKLLEPSQVSVISDSVAQSITQIRQTIHELYTYRIELELQNEELQNTQVRLQEVSQDYADFYNFSPVAYVSLNNVSQILKVNNALAGFLGLTKQALLKQPFTDFVQASDQDKLYLYRQALVDGQHPVACEIRLQPKNGQTLWVKCEGFFKNEVSAPEINLILTDITERKQAEQALQDLFNHQDIVLEAEKARIEQEIHDEFGSRLIGLKMELSGLRKQLPPELPHCHEKCAVMNGQVDAALSAIINITTELRPAILDHLGLVSAIEEKIKDFRQQTGIACEVTLPEKIMAMDKYREIAIFRIVQEALTNIALHARASNISVIVETDGNNLQMKITDNGCGMTNSQMHAPGKYGILGMQERALNLGGEVILVSDLKTGTSLELTMPIKASDGAPPFNR